MNNGVKRNTALVHLALPNGPQSFQRLMLCFARRQWVLINGICLVPLLTLLALRFVSFHCELDSCILLCLFVAHLSPALCSPKLAIIVLCRGSVHSLFRKLRGELALRVGENGCQHGVVLGLLFHLFSLILQVSLRNRAVAFLAFWP